MKAQFLSYALALLSLSGSVPAQKTAALNGQVTDPFSAGIPAVSVQIHHDKTCRGAERIADRSVSTDQEGTFAVDLPPGRYDIVLLADGYDPVAEKVLVLADKPAIFSKRMRVTQYSGDEIPTISMVVVATTSDVPNQISAEVHQERK
jgi:Carboxypeptidase regulatory-like domain